MKSKVKRTAAIIGTVLILLAVAALVISSFAIVPVGHKGVLVNFGAIKHGTVLNEGLNFKIPFIQRIISVDARVMKVETEASSASKDLQDIKSTIAVNYRVNASQVDQLVGNIGADYENKVISPAINEVTKSVTALYTAEQLITMRSEVSEKMKEQLQLKLSNSYISVISYNIVDFQFSEQFNKAIEEKQIAEQLKLKAAFDLERIKIESEQKVTQAKAEAEALRLKGSQVTKDLILLEYIQKWDGKMPQYVGDGNFLFSLPQADTKQE